jgi:hypothetical protein
MTLDNVAAEGTGNGRPGWNAVADLARQFASFGPGRSAGLRCDHAHVGVLENGEAQRTAAGMVLALLVVATAYACDCDGRVSLDQDSLPCRRIVPTRRGSILDAFNRDHRFSIRELCSLAILTGDRAVLEFLLFFVGRTASVDRALRNFMLRETGFALMTEQWVTTARDMLALVEFMAGSTHFDQVVADLRLMTRLKAEDSAQTLMNPGGDSAAELPFGEIYVFGERAETVGVLLCDEQWGSSVARRDVDRFVDYLARQAAPEEPQEGIPGWYVRHHHGWRATARLSDDRPDLRLIARDQRAE